MHVFVLYMIIFAFVCLFVCCCCLVFLGGFVVFLLGFFFWGGGLDSGFVLGGRRGEGTWFNVNQCKKPAKSTKLWSALTLVLSHTNICSTSPTWKLHGYGTYKECLHRTYIYFHFSYFSFSFTVGSEQDLYKLIYYLTVLFILLTFNIDVSETHSSHCNEACDVYCSSVCVTIWLYWWGYWGLWQVGVSKGIAWTALCSHRFPYICMTISCHD